VKSVLQNLNKIYNEYPRAFWIYNVIVFIDQLGGFMLYPFFALYLTQKFDIGMATVGMLFAMFSVSGFIGGVIGGALTDRMGRKKVIISSLILSSMSALGMAFAPTLEMFTAIAVIVGMLSSIGGPAQRSVVADLLPEGKRSEGYGIIRVVFNLSVIIAPAIAGLLIAKSYMMLFIVDAIISLIAASIVIFVLPETKPQSRPGEKPETIGQTLSGYGKAFRDIPFVSFILVSVMMTLMFMNFNTTLGVFLRDNHGISELNYGYLISMNAVIVVFLQFWVTRRLKKFRPMLVVAFGSLIYGLGFGMYGITSTYMWFAIAMIIVTIGEMIVTPFLESLVANFAPEDMRGRYMAVSSLSWQIAYAGGPYLAGLLLDGPNPNMLWAACAGLGVLTMIGYLTLDIIQHSPAAEQLPSAQSAATD